MIIIHLKKLLNKSEKSEKRNKRFEGILRESARAMLETTHTNFNWFKISGITERRCETKETYLIHLVPKCAKTIQYFYYIFNILKPNIELIKQRFICLVALHIDVAKAYDFDLSKTINTDVQIEHKHSQFLLSIPKIYIKKLHLLCPMATSQKYLLDSFNLALHQALKNDEGQEDIPHKLLYKQETR